MLIQKPNIDKITKLTCTQILTKKEVYCCSGFSKTFTSLPHKYASIKKKIAKYDNNPYITRSLRKTVRLRSKK